MCLLSMNSCTLAHKCIAFGVITHSAVVSFVQEGRERAIAGWRSIPGASCDFMAWSFLLLKSLHAGVQSLARSQLQVRSSEHRILHRDRKQTCSGTVCQTSRHLVPRIKPSLHRVLACSVDSSSKEPKHHSPYNRPHSSISPHRPPSSQPVSSAIHNSRSRMQRQGCFLNPLHKYKRQLRSPVSLWYPQKFCPFRMLILGERLRRSHDRKQSSIRRCLDGPVFVW